jgi:hypothetical protein
MTDVSVLLTVYGDERRHTPLPTVVDAWLGQDIDCEVVVATDAGTRIDPALVARAGGGLRVVSSDDPTADRGLLGNLAAGAARSEWLYITDVDVVPLSRGYLGDAIAAAKPDRELIQPRMLRLIGPQPAGRPWEWRLPADAGSVCFVSTGPDGELVTHPDESVFVWTDFDGQLWVDPPAEVPSFFADEFRRRPALHWGAVLVQSAVFAEVGGYCERYPGWGCEDEDLLEKLTSRGPSLRAWAEHPDLLCLHFEHPPARDTPEYAANRALLERRRALGPDVMIAEDLARASS